MAVHHGLEYHHRMLHLPTCWVPFKRAPYAPTTQTYRVVCLCVSTTVSIYLPASMLVLFPDIYCPVHL